MSRKILIVDDSAVNRLLLKKTLGRDYDIIEAENGAEAMTLLNKHYKMLSAILLDIVMPVMDGYEVLRAMRDNVLLAQIPVIMVTGSEDEESRVKALSFGANDFILKPFNPDIVKHCLKNNIALRETASILNAIQKDKLTGLFNREAFFEKVSSMISSREPGYYVLSCFDIDNFKLINDQYGASEGDRILREIGKAVNQNMEEIQGIAGRISADNFAALLPASEKMTDTLRKMLDKTLVSMDQQAVSFSVGRYVATDLSLPASAIYDRAFIAKQSVKGRYDEHIAYFDDAMLEKLIRDQQITSDMEIALVEHQFEAWFQPQYNHATGALMGAEALARWRHPQKGIIPPGEFIPLFEQNGFIYEMDKYIWREVCKYLRKWLSEGREPFPVSVNISRYDVFRADLIDVLSGLIAEYEIPVDLLRLEITESAFTTSSIRIVAIIKQLIGLGFTVEIDDFGSGYSSLNTLKNVPAQVVKLDMRFLDGGDDSQRGGNILESIVRMTKWLGMTVLAEGVEEKDQADFLKSIGCTYVQGYLYARPLPAREFEELISCADIESRPVRAGSESALFGDSFWDPKSVDSLVFNSYSGGACVYEFHAGQIEMIRVTDKYIQSVFGPGMTAAGAMRIRWEEHIDAETYRYLMKTVRGCADTDDEATGEYRFMNLPGCPKEIWLRSTIRVLASTDDRILVYCTSVNITNQREAEKQRSEAIKRLELVLANIDSAVQATAFDENGARLVFSNDRYYSLLGLAKEKYETEKPDPFSFIHPDDRERTRAQAERANEDKKPYTVAYRLLRQDGFVYWLQSHVSFIALPGVEGTVQLAVTNDITAVKNAERENAALAGKLQAVMDNVGCGITAITYNEADVEYLLINDRYYELLGYGKEEYAALPAFSPIVEEDRLRVADAARDAYEHGTPATLEFRARKKDGSVIWMRDTMTRTRFAGIEKPVQLSMFFDITAERQAEQELLDDLPSGAALYEYDGENFSAVHINKRYWELLNRAPGEHSELSLLDPVHPDDRAGIRREVDSAIRQNRDISCDLRLRYGGESYRPFHIAGRIRIKPSGVYAINALYTPISNEAMSVQETLPIALQSVMDFSSEVSYIKGRDLRYILCSHEFALLAGRADEMELVGGSAEDVFPPEFAKRYEAVDREIMETGKSFVDIDLPFPTKNGSRRLLFSKYPLLDANGSVIGVYGSGRDITETRIAKSRLEMLTNNIPGGIAVYEGTPDALSQIRLTYFSDGFCRLFGYTREEYEKLASVNPLGLVFTEDIGKMLEKVVALARDGVPLDYVYRAKTNGGRIKWINVKAVMGEPNGNLQTVNAVFFDVTEQRDALERLRVSEEINRLALKQSGNVVCQYDIPGKRLLVPDNANPIFELQQAEEDIPDKAIREGRISADTVEKYAMFFEAIHKGKAKGEALFQRKSAKGWRWIEARSSTIFSESGEPLIAVISYADVTESIEKDAAYKKWQQSLRDRKPESYSLFHCNLSRNMVHGSPAGLLIPAKYALQGSRFTERASNYVRQCVLGEDRERFLSIMERDAQLQRYNQGVRTAALEYREKLPSGGFRWLRLTVDLVDSPYSSEVEAYLLFEDIDQAKRAELAMIERAETDPLTGLLNRATFAAQVDKRLSVPKPGCQHALLMLDIDGFKLVNDAFGHGAGDQMLADIGELLRGNSRREDLVGRLGGDEFVIFLCDIPDEEAAAKKAGQVCDLVRKTITSDVSISGSVGVALYPKDGNAFAELYKKADETLYYVKGTGKNKYAFYQPNRSGLAERPRERQEESEELLSKTRRRRMLIVDDNNMDYELLANLFKDDFHIEKAGDGSSALIKIRHYGSAISVVLLDLLMPGMDGFAVLKKMQRSAETRSIPVVVVSGADDREASLTAIRDGAADFVTKPVDPDVLRIRVNSAISKAENEQLRAQNSYLALQNNEIDSYKVLFERTGLLVIVHDWVKGTFQYTPSVGKHLYGRFDSRSLWHVLLSDMVTDSQTVKGMQQLVHELANDRSRMDACMTVKLKASTGGKREYFLNVYKQTNDYGLAVKLILTLRETDPRSPVD